jgi:hypothetical protein
MNWDAVGAIGEIIGAVAVVISLLYLSNQIRHGTRTAEDAAFREVFGHVGTLVQWMNEPQHRPVLLKGLLEYDSLAPEEKVTFDSMLTMLLTYVESAVISNSAELIKDETMGNWREYVGTRYFAYPGAQQWWHGTKGIYIQGLQNWVDDMIEEVDMAADYWGIKVPPNKSFSRIPTNYPPTVCMSMSRGSNRIAASSSCEVKWNRRFCQS